jgi:cytochrome b involved in lipid metabolism
MRKVILLLAITAISLPVAAQAHQPVALLATDTTAEKGPLLIDGTVSFAIRASFSKANEVRAFRAQLAAGDSLAIQYLIIDKTPENKLKSSQLPVVTVTSPSGAKLTMKINERTKFFEPYSRTNYLYLSRYSAEAEAGIYSISIRSKAKSAVTVAVGEKEIQGEARRGPAPSPTPVVTPTPTATSTATPTATPSATPTPTPSLSKTPALTMKDVAENNSPKSCWSAIDGKIYDLTRWIKSHPGGQSAITFLCGTDGTKAFLAQHRGESSPFSRLASFYIGPLAP